MIFEWFLICFLVFLVSFLGIKYFLQINQIKEIRRVVRGMAQGDYSWRMSFSPSDHLGDVARNIHELGLGMRKQLDELIIEKDKLETILSNMAEGVLVVSLDKKIIHLNPSFQTMFDIRNPHWHNKFYWEIVSNQSIVQSIRDVLVSHKMVRKEILIMNTKEMNFNMQISPVLDSKGKMISLVAVFHDVTELKKFERLRSEFVANVSHELKTPLTSIRGFVETLRDGAVNDQVHALKFLDIILKQTKRLEDLVTDLLVLSSLESKEVKMNFVKTDVTSVIQAVVMLKKKDIESHGHHLELDFAPQLPLVFIDTLRMEQVFLNLLDNAVKFTPKGGLLKIKVCEEKQYLRVDVTDNGPGISSEHTQRIFERFFRADKSRNSQTGGTGLGLSIVKHIIEAHQGKITLQSSLGSGSTFSVFLKTDMV